VNPISQELSVLRRSLWPGLLSAAAQNSSRQQDRLRLFEVGAQFETLDGSIVEKDVLAGLVCGSRWPEQWASDRAQADFFDVKHDVESVLSLAGRAASLRFIAGEHPALRPGRSARILLDDGEAGWIGELHPGLQQQFDLKHVPILFSLELEKITTASLPVYRRSSKFPSIRRDLAIVVAHDVPADSILICVRNAAGDLLKNVNVFDVYRGPGIDSSRKSIGLGLILQDTYRTLTDEDADRTVAAVVERLGSELGATIRI
jgi:phenylalanyl-tRNA synthetase beta chain